MEKTRHHHTHHPVQHNAYLKELETMLAGIKAQLIEKEDATRIDYKSKQITEKAAEHDRRAKKNYYTKASSYLKELTDTYNAVYDLQLVADKIVTMATIAGTDESTVATNIAASARSTEAALESVLAMVGLVAKIQSRAQNDGEHDDHKTIVSVIVKSAAELQKKAHEAGKAAEIASMASLNLTIAAAESNALYLVNHLSDFSASISALATNISQTKADAASNAENAYTALQTALTQLNEAEKNLELSHLEWRSAQTANNEENLQLGLQEAHKLVIEDERKAATQKK
ncbi:MAG TPA: hypothetical protein VGF30_13295 [Bacteroidia bacterium]